jgi:DNA polymerase-4
VTAAKLRGIGVERLVDVRTIEAGRLQEAVGSQASWLRQLASGNDDREVVADRAAKSCGTETTFAKDLTDVRAIRDAVADMARDNAAWLHRKALYARTVTIKVRYDDFTTITRSQSAAPTRDAEALAARAVALVDRTDAGRRPVRLLGVSVHGLSSDDGLGLFSRSGDG